MPHLADLRPSGVPEKCKENTALYEPVSRQ